LYSGRMHEMSIAMSIVDAAEKAAREAGAARVTAIELDIGPMSGVMADALEFCFEAAARGSMAQGARLAIHAIAAVGECASCGRMGEARSVPARCRACGGFLAIPPDGATLRLRAIEVEDAMKKETSHV